MPIYQNSQLSELLAPHQKRSSNAGTARKYEYSSAPEKLPRGIATTIKVQLTPHDGITSYPTTTSTELEDNKRLNRKQYAQNFHEVTLALQSEIPIEIIGKRKHTCTEEQDTFSHAKACNIAERDKGKKLKLHFAIILCLKIMVLSSPNY